MMLAWTGPAYPGLSNREKELQAALLDLVGEANALSVQIEAKSVITPQPRPTAPAEPNQDAIGKTVRESVNDHAAEPAPPEQTTMAVVTDVTPAPLEPVTVEEEELVEMGASTTADEINLD
jgi:hypothetical protein